MTNGARTDTDLELPCNGITFDCQPGPTSNGNPGVYNTADAQTMEQFLAAAAVWLKEPNPHPLQPLLDCAPQELFLPLPPISDVLGELHAWHAVFARRSPTSHHPPTPPPASSEDQHPCMSRDGYVYDLDAAHCDSMPGSYADVIVHPFLPSVSYIQGPLHACTLPRAAISPATASANTAQVQHGVLICEICTKAFDSRALAVVHAHVHGPLHLYHCGHCKLAFKTAVAREVHWDQYQGCRTEHGMSMKIAAAEAIQIRHNGMPKAAGSISR